MVVIDLGPSNTPVIIYALCGQSLSCRLVAGMLPYFSVKVFSLVIGTVASYPGMFLHLRGLTSLEQR